MANRSMEFMDHQFTQKEGVVLAQLPQELMTEILIRLPVKSLLRFKCVSKSFCAVIESVYFTNLHLVRSSEHTSHLNLIFPTREEISTNYNPAKLHVSNFSSNPLHYPDLYGYCNGVFLLLVHQSLILWNPSTHQYRILPSPPDGICYDKNTRLGLGYNSSQNEYKVVLIDQFLVKDQPIQFNLRVFIFGLRSNSWRKVGDFLPIDGAHWCFSNFAHFADGNLHWLFFRRSRMQQLVAFDLAKETFSILSKPDYHPYEEPVTYLNVLNECLCMGYCISGIEGKALLYVRNKDGQVFKWSLLFSITTDQLRPFLELHTFAILGVMGYSKEEDKVMLDLGWGYIVAYDLKKRSFQPTYMKIPIYYKCRYKTRFLVESLVSVV